MSRRKSIRLLGVVGALAALAAASPVFGDGAIAIEDLEGERAGLSAGYATAEEAQQAALAHCGEGCSVVETFSGGCAAVATHEGEDSTIYGWFVGADSESEAISQALEACRERGGTDCAVRLSACDGSEPSGANGGAEAPFDQPGTIQSAGETFRDCPNCPEMVVIPTGSFRMGCLSNDDDCYQEEFPVHEVMIRSFAMSKYEVTLAQWDACVAAGGCDWGRLHENPSHPMRGVSWEDAQSYVAWLSEVTGHTYRLPTEGEWEYAARAGSVTKHHFGNDESQLCQYANHADRDTRFDWRNTACSDGVGEQTARVGRYEPNEFGLYDMHGNVWEWVEDCWNESYEGAPSDGSAWLSGNCDLRILRGGSFDMDPRELRSANRAEASSDDNYDTNGFRVARALTP